jgi:competence ComEA-like helix-hairpin-helix protein
VLTEAERRGALMVAALLALGAGYDLWRARSTSPVAGAAAPAAVARAAAPAPQRGAPVASPADSGPAMLDLNAASPAELESLPGIGPTLARRIVAHRRAHGRFREVGELIAVRGIGPRLLARIEALVRAGPDVPAADSGAGSHPGGHPPRR